MLSVLQQLGKVRTADDKGIPALLVRQKAWPANAQRATPRQVQKEFASRVGLPILLDIGILKETVRLGIKAGQWLYFDPRKQCAYSIESPTSPLVEITDDVELIVPEAAEGIPICGAPSPEPDSPVVCPVCRNPQNACTCSPVPITPETGQLEGEGSPARAFRRIADLAQERGVRRLASVDIRADGSDREFSRDLQAMALAVPQLPRATVRVELRGVIDLPEGDHLGIDFDGSWKRYRRIGDTILKVAREAEKGTGHITVKVTFPGPVDPAGTEIGSIRDTFTRISPGRVRVIATPAP